MPAWYVKNNGEKLGPWSSQQLKQAVSNGRVDATAMVLQEGQEEWKPITRIKGLEWPMIPSVSPQLLSAVQQPPAPQPIYTAPIVYAAPVAQPMPTQQQIVNVHMHGGKQWSRGVAMLLSLIIPGLGQVYKGQIINGLVWFVLVIVGYIPFVIPGIILHILCILGAASGRNR